MTMRNQTERGFTMVELAIVLGVIGIVLGGIWAFSNSARQSARVEQSIGQLAIVTNNIRSYYLSLPNIVTGDVTATLAGRNVFPREMLRPSTSFVDHPWGPARPNGTALAAGGVGVSGTNNYYFILTYRGLNTESCIAFATRATSGATANGLTTASINGVAATTLPITVGTAGTQCATSGATTGSDVALTYRLRLN
jgi:prepilin-type N-terminal cleavage/methylation domain-containing protein